jgi:putative component of membrane protein insertase Oxa1/YidC/SpoIIIJ protein YidD
MWRGWRAIYLAGNVILRDNVRVYRFSDVKTVTPGELAICRFPPTFSDHRHFLLSFSLFSSYRSFSREVVRCQEFIVLQKNHPFAIIHQSSTN